jgi:hypothetical protein
VRRCGVTWRRSRPAPARARLALTGAWPTMVIVGIHRSARITEVFGRLMTELRLGFLALVIKAIQG